jgi:hypothetical protein
LPVKSASTIEPVFHEIVDDCSSGRHSSLNAEWKVGMMGKWNTGLIEKELF